VDGGVFHPAAAHPSSFRNPHISSMSPTACSIRLEDVVEHYQSFFSFLNVVRGFPLPLIADEDIEPIVAYMRKAL
jgi:hypothetical protein